MPISNIVNYFKDCYTADNRNLTIENFFSAKIEGGLIMSGQEELLNNHFSQIHLNFEIADNYNKILTVYEKEKSLIYCSLFIIGKDLEENSISKICAPLVYYQVDLFLENEVYYIELDKKHPAINFDILKIISEKFTENPLIHSDFIEFFAKENQDIYFTDKLLNLLKNHLPELDIHLLQTFPELFSEEQIKTHLNKKNLDNLSGFTIVPASGIGIIKKSTETIGIINELTAIASAKYFSRPLLSIFDNQTFEYKPEKSGKVPAILNEAQEKIIKNVPLFPISLIIGPPGTGKSYTIANLAIEQMSKGNSVLICSKTDQAVDIIAEKIESQLNIKDVIVRAGRKEYLKDLKTKLQNILNSIISATYQDKEKNSRLKKDISNLEKKIAKLETLFSKNIDNEIKWGNFIAYKSETPGFIDYLKLKYKKQKTKNDIKLWEISSEIQDSIDKLISKTRELIEQNYAEQLGLSLKKNREELLRFLKGIRSRTGNKQEDIFSDIDFKVLLKTFPIWLVKFSDIYKVLPLQKELFDLAIIDESTQCDISACIPLIQRAKKTVFTGDPHQLRHVSFISFSNQDALKQKYNLDFNDETFNYRENSILDIVNNSISSSNQIFFLNEHFRSVPAIIDFSNRNFYSNALKIMTNRPENLSKGLEFISCKGQRNEKGFNAIEVEILLNKLNEIIEEEKNISDENCRTIGILSPFRAQIEHISEQIFKKTEINLIKKHKISINTAYGFQGDERDIMLISFCLDNNSHSVAFHHLNKNDVFNVSITRARSNQYIFYSFDSEKIRQYSLLSNYFSLADVCVNNISTKTEKDYFAVDVSEQLKKHEIKIWSAFNIAGLEIDLLIKKDNKTIGIDLIGYPGQYNEAFTFERYKLLKRTGIVIFPLPYSFWHFDKENCIQNILNLLN